MCTSITLQAGECKFPPKEAMILRIDSIFFSLHQDRICYYKAYNIKRAEEPGMNIAFVIYEGMIALDFIGMYDPVVRLKGPFLLTC